MNTTCKHIWKWEPRNNRKELWKICEKCGQEQQLKIVSVEPLKGSSKLHEKRKRMGTSTINRRVDDLFRDET